MFPGFDPSKLDPKVIQELTDLMRTLPPEKLMQMQSIMHNSMAGFDIAKSVQEFEATLPSEFRLRLANIMTKAGPLPAGLFPGAAGGAAMKPDIEIPAAAPAPITNVDEARLTLLKAVRDGSLTPEEALQALFY